MSKCYWSIRCIIRGTYRSRFMIDPHTKSKILVAFFLRKPQSNIWIICQSFILLCKRWPNMRKKNTRCLYVYKRSKILFFFCSQKRNVLCPTFSIFLKLNSTFGLSCTIVAWYTRSIEFVTRDIIRSTADHLYDFIWTCRLEVLMCVLTVLW